MARGADDPPISRGFGLRWLLPFAAAASLIAVVQLLRGSGARVDVAGAGPIGLLREGDAPPGARYFLEVSEAASLEDASLRIDRVLGRRPWLVVVGLDARGLPPEAAEAALPALMQRAQAAATVSVVLGLSPWPEGALAPRWRAACRESRRTICVDAAAHAQDPEALRSAVAAAVSEGLVMLEGLRASTQVRR